MGALNIGEIYRVRMFTADSEQTALTTFYFRVNVVNGAGQNSGQLAFDFDAAIAPLLQAVLANTASYRGTGVQRVKPVPVEAEVYRNTTAGPGTAGAVGLPRQTCGLLSMYDGGVGRKARGRSYVPFPSASDNATLGVPTAGYVTALQAFGTAAASFNTVGLAPDTVEVRCVLWHKRVAPDPLAPGYETDVESIVARNVWATQRRRGSEGRPNASPV